MPKLIGICLCYVSPRRETHGKITYEYLLGFKGGFKLLTSIYDHTCLYSIYVYIYMYIYIYVYIYIHIYIYSSSNNVYLPPCTTTAEYTFSKRLNSLILAIYHQTNIRVDPFALPRSLVDQVAKRVHLAWGPHASLGPDISPGQKCLRMSGQKCLGMSGLKTNLEFARTSCW